MFELRLKQASGYSSGSLWEMVWVDSRELGSAVIAQKATV